MHCDDFDRRIIKLGPASSQCAAIEALAGVSRPHAIKSRVFPRDSLVIELVPQSVRKRPHAKRRTDGVGRQVGCGWRHSIATGGHGCCDWPKAPPWSVSRWRRAVVWGRTRESALEQPLVAIGEHLSDSVPTLIERARSCYSTFALRTPATAYRCAHDLTVPARKRRSPRPGDGPTSVRSYRIGAARMSALGAERLSSPLFWSPDPTCLRFLGPPQPLTCHDGASVARRPQPS